MESTIKTRYVILTNISDGSFLTTIYRSSISTSNDIMLALSFDDLVIAQSVLKLLISRKDCNGKIVKVETTYSYVTD